MARHPQGAWPRWQALLRHRMRDFAAALLLLVGLAVPSSMPFDLRALIAFDVAALARLIAAWVAMLRTSVSDMPRHAREHDEGKWTALALGVGIATAVIVAVIIELKGVREPSAFRIALAAATILLSWILSNTLFALHYAHAYYGEHAHSAKGLNFPGTERPDYWDFVYFAFVVGSTFQTSDVAITSRRIRRTVTAQAALAYFFTVVVLAISVSVIASLG